MVDQSDLGAGKVEGVLEIKTVLVKYQDGHGKAATNLAFVIPGGEVYFLGREAVNLKPAQKWVKDAIAKALHADGTANVVTIPKAKVESF